MENKHYFYVLECADKTFYAGYTTDLMRRVEEHNTSNKGAKYTRVRRPVKLVCSVVYATRSQATKAEAAFKKLTRKNKEAFIRDTATKKF